MEWENESELKFLCESLKEDGVKGKVSSWDEYQVFNAFEAAELRRLRIFHNEAFAQRSKQRLMQLQEAEENGVLFMK